VVRTRVGIVVASTSAIAPVGHVVTHAPQLVQSVSAKAPPPQVSSVAAARFATE
jgi:hypothetical protein